jgi:5-methylcytosine-specific restriction endonuclease McrA
MEYTYSGIDRLDNAIGYEPPNCVPCCDICNLAKRDMSYGAFVAWMRRTHARLESTALREKTFPPNVAAAD